MRSKKPGRATGVMRLAASVRYFSEAFADMLNVAFMTSCMLSIVWLVEAIVVGRESNVLSTSSV